MNSLLKAVSLITLLGIVLMACSSSPTGRPQLTLLPESQMTEMGKTAFQQIKQQTPTTESVKTQQYVQCVADQLLAELPDAGDWEIQVFKDESVNAFALPGGNTGVNTGLLNVAANQHQLAAVAGHEIAHVLANHSNARVSASYATTAGLAAVQVALGASGEAINQTLVIDATMAELESREDIDPFDYEELDADEFSRQEFSRFEEEASSSQ